MLVDTVGCASCRRGSGLPQVIVETDGSGNLSAYYVRAGDELLAVMRPAGGGAWNTRIVHHDGLGSVRALTDETGTTIDTRGYEAFGTKNVEAGNDPLTYGFAGEPFQTDSMLAYHRARWMDARVGRFEGMDRVDGNHQRPATLQRYLYTSNLPTGVVDPSGNEDAEPNIAALFVTPLALGAAPSVPNSFPDKDRAISAALQAAGNASMGMNVIPPDETVSGQVVWAHPEYFGFLFEYANGSAVRFGFTTPVTDLDPAAVDISTQAHVWHNLPRGVVPIGIFHTHPNYTAEYNTTDATGSRLVPARNPCPLQFSQGDANAMRYWGLRTLNEYLNPDFGGYLSGINASGAWQRFDWYPWSFGAPDIASAAPDAPCAR
jgi:RHS repeat-associated protein